MFGAGEWAEALLTVGSAVAHPVGGILLGRLEPGGVHISRGISRGVCRLAGSMAPAQNRKQDRK